MFLLSRELLFVRISAKIGSYTGEKGPKNLPNFVISRMLNRHAKLKIFNLTTTYVIPMKLNTIIYIHEVFEHISLLVLVFLLLTLSK